MLQSLYLLRMHNPEGYTDNVTINPYGPFYNYYNKYQLGNNREVWRVVYSINYVIIVGYNVINKLQKPTQQRLGFKIQATGQNICTS